MKAAQKVAAFIVALVAVFAVAVWVGKTVGPDDRVAEAGAPELAGEPQSTQGAYTLALTANRFAADNDVPLQFRILDASGTPVTRYVENHEKLLHLIVVRNDLTGFQHIHPVLDANGTWRVPVDLARAGDYRVFADFTPAGGPAQTLGANVHVAGQYDPQPLPAAAAATDVDRYTVTLSGTATANEESTLTLTVSRDGRPVTDLAPYLGAYGHLVALRASDLAYLHVHPMGEPGDGVTPAGPEIRFHTTFPSASDYRLFLDFQHRGVVRTAKFTVSVDDGRSAPGAEHAPAGHGH
jgi:hypothetical protein